jgi:hypothetical protein
MSVRYGRCSFVEDAKISKLRSSGAMWWCVNHSVRTTSAMRECLRATRSKGNWPWQKPGAPAPSATLRTGFIDELEQEIARRKSARPWVRDGEDLFQHERRGG